MSDPQARLSGEDLTFWWLDSPAQPTTMAMLMVLDREPDLTLHQMQGSMNLQRCPDPKAYARLNYEQVLQSWRADAESR